MNRRICRQVLECGDGVREVTALSPAALKIPKRAVDTATPHPKRRLRRLRRRSPRRSRANSRRTRFMAPMRFKKEMKASQEPQGRAGSPLRADACNDAFLQGKGRRAPVLHSTNAKRGHQLSATAEGGRSDAPYLGQPVYVTDARPIREVETAQTAGFGRLKLFAD
jgi:hypothetical protein